MSRVFIFENSDSPHETSVLSAIAIFQDLNYEVNLVLGSLAYGRLAPVIDGKKIRIYRAFHFLDLIKCLLAIKRRDALYFNTIALRNILFTVFYSAFSSQNMLYVRNANSWFYFRPNTDSPATKFLAWCLFKAKRFLLKRAKVLMVGQNNIRSFLQERTSVPVIYVPFNIKQTMVANHATQNHPLKIVVPGTVDFQRKNNSVIVDAIQLVGEQFIGKFEIVFLGRAANQYSREFLEKWSKPLKGTIMFYPGFVEQSEFNRQLTEADLILGVINVDYKGKYYTEKYGLTKDTGVEAHTIAYSKPLIINQDYAVDPNLSSSVVHFSTAEELKAIFERAVSDPEWVRSLKAKAFDNCRNFELPMVMKNIRDKLQP